ncbi:MAG: PIG-L family deacetylase [Gemmatimonadaceae bacterium]|nr:PIG-L family deacetylase [Chitinophagaceae bacterium]
MKRFSTVFLLVIFSCFNSLFAQAPATVSSSEILLGLKKMNVLGSVLYMAAHPDDENTRLLAYLSKEKLYRTGYLSLTRGDGGQNLIGNEQGIELGLIRTQELMAARRIDGAEQFFSRAYDFGYSKSTEEALKKWDREKVLSDAVWIIRKFQPDVIITRFPPDERAGHGHHSASAVIAIEAFSAAADPTRFPEQLKWVKPWQAKRILWNTFNFGGNAVATAEQFSLDVGAYNPVLGLSYGEIAAESRSQHKSQGFGVTRQRGEAMELFSVWKGDLPKTDLMDAVDVGWSRVSGGESIKTKIEKVASAFDVLNPGKSVAGLIEIYQAINSLPEQYWKTQKLNEVQKLIEAASGFYAEATTTEAMAVQTDSLRVNIQVNSRNGNKLTVKKVAIDNFSRSFDTTLMPNRNFIFQAAVFVPSSAPLTQPFWLRNEMKEGHFEINDQSLIGVPDNEAAFMASFDVNIDGLDLNIQRPVRQKSTDPVKGELYEPIAVVPPVTVTPVTNLLLANGQPTQSMRMTVKALKTVVKPELNLNAVKGWQVSAIRYTVPDTLKKGQELDIDIDLKPVASQKENGKQPLFVSVNTGGELYSTTQRTIHYDHIPDQNYFRLPVVNLLTLDLKTAGKRIAYIEGAGDYIPVALKLMGYEVTILSDNDISATSLSKFDAIITGVRAYNVRPSLNVYYNKLMQYVEAGGNLIVQYNTSTQSSAGRMKIGPYPFDISRTRVSDETAKITVVKSGHQLFNFPNKINDADFNGWVQERSIYHAGNWDKRYETLFSMKDPSEKQADEGALIMTRYGKGVFVYTGLVLFRELPAGVPGAYRLLANIIALNKKKPF